MPVIAGAVGGLWVRGWALDLWYSFEETRQSLDIIAGKNADPVTHYWRAWWRNHFSRPVRARMRRQTNRFFSTGGRVAMTWSAR